MLFYKQSVAPTIIVGPILDNTGAEYASAVIGDLSISKNGGTLTPLASGASLTHVSNAQYTLLLRTTDVDTLGRAQITCNKGTYQMPTVGLMVIPSSVFDAITTNAANTTGGFLIATSGITGLSGTIANTTNIEYVGSITGVVDANIVEVLTEPVNPSGTVDVNVLTITSGVIDANALATDAITEIWAASTAPTASAIADAVWDEPLVGHSGAGTAGSGLISGGNPWQTTLPGSYTGSQAGKMISDILVYSSGSVDVGSIYGSVTAASKLSLSADAIVTGTVSSGSSTTSITSISCSPSGAAIDQFKGRIMIFRSNTTTPALRGQASDITASTNAANPTFTVTAFTTAPASGDFFVIV